jgi:hypothetical protein
MKINIHKYENYFFSKFFFSIHLFNSHQRRYSHIPAEQSEKRLSERKIFFIGIIKSYRIIIFIFLLKKKGNVNLKKLSLSKALFLFNGKC